MENAGNLLGNSPPHWRKILRILGNGRQMLRRFQGNF